MMVPLKLIEVDVGLDKRKKAPDGAFLATA
jgi:hypothetical protein